MRRALLSAALSLALPAAGFAASGAMPATSPMPAKGAAAPAAQWVMAAFVGNMTGSAQMQRPGSDVWMMTRVGQQIPAGSVIKTGPDSTIVLGFTDGSKVSLGANAVFKLEEVAASRLSMYLLVGKLDAWVAKLKKRTFQIRNPVSVASVRGTTLSSSVIWPDSIAIPALPPGFDNVPIFSASQTSSLRAETVCFTGAVAVADIRGNTVDLAAGQQVTGDGATGNAAPTKSNTPPPAEPTVVVPPTLAAAPPPSEAPASTTEAPAETTTTKDPAPVNNPLQETTTASPSAP